MKFIPGPMPFQGNLSKRRYFEGWYLKHVSRERSRVLSFIPGVSLTPLDRHCFIQAIDGISGKTWYIRYPVHTFKWERSRFSVKLGLSEFTLDGCSIRIEAEGIEISGQLTYSEMDLYPRAAGHPGIMGWFSYIPGLECRHDVLSMNHRVRGNLLMNGELLDFSDGNGYIEKDWGRNFPSSYIWIQCNDFNERGVSFMLAVARVPLKPFMGDGFPGFLGFLKVRGVVKTFGTWNSWTLEHCLFPGDGKGSVSLVHGSERITCRVVGSRAGLLKAPDQGGMTQVVKESVNASVALEIDSGKGETIVLEGSPGGFEQRGALEL